MGGERNYAVHLFADGNKINSGHIHALDSLLLTIRYTHAAINGGGGGHGGSIKDELSSHVSDAI